MNRPRVIVILGSAALLVLVVVAWFFVLNPRQDQVSETKAQTASVEQQTAALHRQIAELEKLKAAMPQRLAELAELKAGFPSTAQIPEVIAELRNTAAASGCTVVSLTAQAPAVSAAPAPTPSAAPSGTASPAPAQPPAQSFSDVATMPIHMSVTGTYPQLVAFLKGLETAPRAYLMTTATVGGGATAKGGTDTLAVAGTMFVISGTQITVPSAQPSATPTPSA